jgi:glycyl-tRNA synthetase beta chain
MTKREDFLVEIHTEELPPKALFKLAEALREQICEKLTKLNLGFAGSRAFATPRRLAVLVEALENAQPDQVIERKGPAIAAAYDQAGQPTKACEGFAASCGVNPKDLFVIKNQQGEFVGYKQAVQGQSVFALLPALVEQAINALPVPKRMRWGSSDVEFSRPIHSIIMLYGDQVVPGKILGFIAGRATRGHRFHAPTWFDVPSAASYATTMENVGHVKVDFAERRAMIIEQVEACIASLKQPNATWCKSHAALLDEVTGLVEWPTAVLGHYDAAFLEVPREVLIAAMEDHQRYFAVMDTTEKLLPHFVTVSNIQSQNQPRLITGNERVLRARLADAAFFYQADKKRTLASRLDELKQIVYQAKLGTMYDKAERLSQITAYVAKHINGDEAMANRAGWLAKADLTSSLVGEFPELQGMMGQYYALHDGEPVEVATAIGQQYTHGVGSASMVTNPIAQALRVADRADSLIGAFGINQIPTGDKDPYGLRRAALGILRTILDGRLDIDLKDLFIFVRSTYQVPLENDAAITQALAFVQERLRVYYYDKQVASDVFTAVAAIGSTNPLDFDARIQAVQAFKQLSEAQALSVANKRVSNILAKHAEQLDAEEINPVYFEHAAEQSLLQALERKSDVVASLYQARKYDEVLLQLADLRQPVDDFFDHVMVMADEKTKRENRILILNKLRSLFLHVADIALLQ